MDNDKHLQTDDQIENNVSTTDSGLEPTADAEPVTDDNPFGDEVMPTVSADEAVESPFSDDVTPVTDEAPAVEEIFVEPVADETAEAIDKDQSETAVAKAVEPIGKPGMDWYVIRIATGYEKFVETSLREQIAIESMKDAFGEIMVPTEEVVEIRAGQKRKSRRKFFPGYMLIQMERDEKVWHLVRNITHVLGFVGGRRDKLPVPLTPKEVSDITDRIRLGEDKPRPKVLFEVGEVVRIVDGPFADFDGTVEEVNYEKSRLKISVLLFGRSTPVELEFAQVEKS